MSDMAKVSVEYMSTSVPFRGKHINLSGCDTATCPHSEIGVVHHHDDYGRHYCPTGFVMCYECGGIGHEPEPAECHLWREFPQHVQATRWTRFRAWLHDVTAHGWPEGSKDV